VTVARAAASSVLSQGIGVATGLQSSFNWKSVAASASGAGVGWSMNNALGLTDANGMGIDQSFGLESIGKATLSGFAAGLTTAVARGGRISIQQVATDAFGNALGQSLAATSRPTTPTGASQSGATDDPLGDFIAQNQGRWGQRQANYDQFLDAFANPTRYGQGGDVQLAAGPGYDGGIGISDRDRNIALMLELANRPDPNSIESIRQPDGTYRMEIQGVGSVSSPSLLPSSSALPSMFPAPAIIGDNAYGGQAYDSGSDTYPVTDRSVSGQPLPSLASETGAGQDILAVRDFTAGWQQPYWSVLQGPQSTANKLGSVARNVADGAMHIGGSVLSGLTGYGAGNLAIQEFGRGQYGRAVIHGMQAIGEAGMTVLTAGEYALAKSAMLGTVGNAGHAANPLGFGALRSPSELMGVEPASAELLAAVGSKRSLIIARTGSEELRMLDYFGAEASVGGVNNSSILLRENPSKAAVLEEFLHGTQARLGIVDRLGSSGLGSAETHVKDFMMRHQQMLGLSDQDVRILKVLRDKGL